MDVFVPTGPLLVDFGIAKKYGENLYKVTAMRCAPNLYGKQRNFTQKGCAGNENKLRDNLSRATARVSELALCNPWTLFVTLTLDPTKHDRQNLPSFIKDLAQFLRNYRRKTGNLVRYLLIPEKHQDGAWHMHGFLSGLPISDLYEFNLGDHIPYKIRTRIQTGKRVFTWLPYQEKFGFADIEVIENREASARYITKYITKNAMRSVTDLNAHIFYASKGLASAQILRKKPMLYSIASPDFQNDYVSTKWHKHEADALAYFEERSTDDITCIDN